MSRRRQARESQIDSTPTPAGCVAELNRRLALGRGVARHEARPDAPDGGRYLWVFDREGDRVIDPPLTLSVTGEQLLERLRSMLDDGSSLWPDATPLSGALSLLLVHLEEAIATRPLGATRLELCDGGVRAV
jgi:hypothetical protein